MDFVRTYLCCCLPQARRRGREAHAPALPDERALLIPPSIEPNISYTDVSYLDQQKLQQRLGTIVRSKEGRMVNLNSHIPFNLHNQVLHDDRTLSRSNSGSLDNLHSARMHHQHHPGSSDPAYYHGNQHHHGYAPSPLSHSRSASRSRSLDLDLRRRSVYDDHSELEPEDDEVYSSSREREYHHQQQQLRRATNEQPRPTPILNVRLVGYPSTTGTGAGGGGGGKGARGERGRARERGAVPSGLPSPKGAAKGPEGGKGLEGAKEGLGGGEEDKGKSVSPGDVKTKRKSTFTFDDVSSIAVSWGD